jgi:hypothetical protein
MKKSKGKDQRSRIGLKFLPFLSLCPLIFAFGLLNSSYASEHVTLGVQYGI